MRKNIKNIFGVAILALLVLIPTINTKASIQHLCFRCIVFAILAVSLNLVVGITGLSNMSHATFFGIGAYTAALLSNRLGVNGFVGIIAGAAVAALFGVLLGLPTLRLKGFYLSLATIGFGQIIRNIEINAVGFTGGPAGIAGIQKLSLFGTKFTKLHYIYFAMILLILLLFVTKRLIASKTGRALFAIKRDEIVAKSLGVKITNYKLLVFTLSAMFAGLIGGMYASYLTFISPDTFTQNDSTTILCMVILGGTSTWFGPVLSATILTLTPELLRFADMLRLIFVGVVMIVAIIAKERGWGNMVMTRIRELIPGLQRKEASS